MRIVGFTFGLCMWGALAISPSGYAHADDPNHTVFEPFLTESSPYCVPISDIAKLSGVKVFSLSPDQFQFVRALYVAIPPVSQELPPGDSAIQAKFGDDVMVALVSGDNVCARFLAPNFVKRMLEEINRAPL